MTIKHLPENYYRFQRRILLPALQTHQQETNCFIYKVKNISGRDKIRVLRSMHFPKHTESALLDSWLTMIQNRPNVDQSKIQSQLDVVLKNPKKFDFIIDSCNLAH